MTGIWDKSDQLPILGGGCVACDRPRMARSIYCAHCLKNTLPDMAEREKMLPARLVKDLVDDLTRPVFEPVALYRFFDVREELLYVGISNKPETRRSQHMENSKWYRCVRSWSVEWYDDRSTAVHHELDAIDVELPIFNRAGADDKRSERAKIYLLQNLALDLLHAAI